MQIDQTKLTENVVKNIPKEKNGMSIENFIGNPEANSGFFASKIETFSSEATSANMSDVTYAKPFLGEDSGSIVDQLDMQANMTVEQRRNQMAVISNTTTPEDYKKIQEDGFSFADTSSRTIITETDKIKAVLAKAGVDISIYGDTLSADELEEITGSKAIAKQIEKSMTENDIPVTSENMQDAKNAYNQAMQINELSDEAKSYLVKNELEPTISNLYKAQFSSQNMSGSYNKGAAVDENQLDAMDEQIRKIIEEAGIPVTNESVSNGKWLIQNGIELTGDNLNYLSKLQGLDIGALDSKQIIDSIMVSIKEGNRPADAYLLDGFSLEEQAQNAVEVIANAKDEDLNYIVENELELNIKNLKLAESVRGNNENVSIADVKAKRILEETRLMMTAEANYALLKRGISIDTKPLENLIEDLKQIEDQYYKDLMVDGGIEATDENVSTFSQTISMVEETKWQPAYALSIGSADESFSVLHQKGEAVRADFVKANERYETMMTAPRADLGDNIRKAFQNVDDILEDLNIDITKENQRAVRILAYNEIPITEENINMIKAADEEVQRAFKNMTPAVTLEMIRKGINPLDLSITELNNVASEINSTTEKESERFSKFLWKLEKNKAITEEEKNSYIGIYRLFAQVEKTDGAAIGSLINQGADITMRNLLSAVRTNKKGSMDYSIDDDFSGVDAASKGPRIDDQIMASYNKNCVSDIMDIISPENINSVIDDEWESKTPEQIKAALEQADEELEVENEALEMEYAKEQLAEIEEAISSSEDIYKYLDRYDIQNSIVNVIAANRMIKNSSRMFNTLFDESKLSTDDIERIRDIKMQILERFSDSIKTPEELAEAQEELAEVAAHAMDNMIIEDRSASSIDIKEMKLVCNQFRIAAQKASQESFVIPVETGDSVTGVSLKIVRGKEDKGLVDIFFDSPTMGKVAASFEAKEKGISGVIAAGDEQTRNILADNLNNLVSAINDNSDENEAMDIRVAFIKDISSEHFEMSILQKELKNASPDNSDKTNVVQTRRLYNIAESFIKSIEELNNIF